MSILIKVVQLWKKKKKVRILFFIATWLFKSDWNIGWKSFIYFYGVAILIGVLRTCMMKRADMLHATVTFFQIGELKKGLNPPSFGDLVFVSPYLTLAVKTGIITGVIAMAVSTLLNSNSFTESLLYHRMRIHYSTIPLLPCPMTRFLRYH